jgi:hypothetical protein
MGAFRPVTFSKKELEGLSPAKRKKLKKEIVRHLETHPGIRKIVRSKVAPTLKKMKKKA